MKSQLLKKLTNSYRKLVFLMLIGVAISQGIVHATPLTLTFDVDLVQSINGSNNNVTGMDGARVVFTATFNDGVVWQDSGFGTYFADASSHSFTVTGASVPASNGVYSDPGGLTIDCFPAGDCVFYGTPGSDFDEAQVMLGSGHAFLMGFDLFAPSMANTPAIGDYISSTDFTNTFDLNVLNDTLASSSPNTNQYAVNTIFLAPATTGGPTSGPTADPEPDNHPTNFMATANSNSQITTTWNDSTGASLPTGYIILCNLTGVFIDPVDGTVPSNDLFCADGSGVRNTLQGVETIEWNSLNSGTNYFFKIFPYSNLGVDVDYKTDGTPATANATTSSVVNLAVTKDDGVTSATPGGSVTYTMIASNAGPNSDPSATFTDNFPAALTCSYTSVAAGGATGNTAAGAGDIADNLSLPDGSSVTYTASCDIDSGATGTLSNTATINASVTDSVPGNNSATDANTVLSASANLAVTKTDGVTSATPGGSITYTMVASNAGPSDDPAASFADTFPADLTCTYTSVTAGGATGNTAAGAGDIADSLSLPEGSSVTYTASCAIDSGATGTLSNTATINASVTDSTPGNNSATDNDTALNAQADLSVTKTDGVTAATPGGTVTYNLVASNAGPSDDPSATFTDTFSADLTCTYTSVAAGGASGNTGAGAGDLSETLNLPSSSSVTYTASCNIDASATGTLSNTASITTSVTDSTPGNNSATDNDTVLSAQADLSVTKTDGVTSATPGGNVTYTLVASNSGPSDDPSAIFTDTFPVGLTCTYTSVATGGATGNTTAGAGDLSETLSLPASSSVNYTATCNIDASATGTLSNTATVTSSVTDSTPGNNSATDNDTVLNAQADLSVTKTDGVTSATPGGNVTYTLVASNSGPSDDPSAMFTDTFPADLTCTYTSVASGGASGNTGAGAGDLSETLNLPANSSVTYTAICNIDASATGTLSNTASITASVTDSTPGNNSATDSDTTLSAEADLSVTKTDGVTSATPGGTVTYTLVASNAGPSDDPSATFADIFPTELTCTYTSVAVGGASGNTGAGAGDLSETLNLPANSSVTYTAICNIDAAVTGTLSNTASITASVTDSTPGNNSATDSDTTLSTEADLSVTKTDGVTSATPGGTVTYTLVASNAGPSDDPSATFADIFPTELTCTYTSVAAGGASGNTPAGAGDLSETLSLPANSSVTYTATCNIDAAATGTLSNTASITGSVTDPTPGNDSATDGDTALSAEADLSVTKTDGVTAATPGGTVTYTLVASNAGPSNDPSVTFADIFPTDLTCTYTSVAAGGATGNSLVGADSLIEILSLPANSSVTYTAICNIDAAATGTLSNTATISSSVTDPSSGNNSATDGDSVLNAQADLSITKTDGVTTATPGGTVTYTLVASNAGPSDDPSVTFADSFPADLTCTYTSVTSGGATGNTAGSGNISETLDMPNGSSVTYTATCNIDAAATGTLTNTATISGSVSDNAPKNNSATDNDTVLTAQADLSVTKTDGVTTATPGGTVTYTLVASNAGPSDDPSVTFVDTFPADLTCTFTSVAAGGATGNTDGSGNISETLDMPNGSSVTYTATCNIDAAATGTLTNTATISGSVNDNAPKNNSATDNDTVLTAQSDLSVTKTDGATTATPGGTVTYTLVASNAGPSDDPSVTFVDTFPADLICTYTSVAADGATDNTDGSGNITETLDMPSGSSVTYTATCHIDAASTGTLSNTATISGSVSDNVTKNNSATDNDTVLGSQADLSVTVSDNIDPIIPGNNLIYTISVENNGPSDALNVSVVDTIDTGLTVVSSSGCDEDPLGYPTCTIGTIAHTESALYTLTVSVDPSTIGTIQNTAVVSTSSNDQNQKNNTYTEETSISLQADLNINLIGPKDPVVPGPIPFTIEVTNNGPSIATNVVVTDMISDGDFVSTVGCIQDPNAYPDCSLGSINSGDTISYEIIFNVVPTDGNITNTVTVTSDLTDGNISNNSSSFSFFSGAIVIPTIGFWAIIFLVLMIIFSIKYRLNNS